jgi:GMP synthase (glutamine-hydrolysing)
LVPEIWPRRTLTWRVSHIFDATSRRLSRAGESRHHSVADFGNSVMPRTAIALRHVAFEDLGLIEPMLIALGWRVEYRDATLDDLTDPAFQTVDLLAVLGGPVGVYESDIYPFLAPETAMVEQRLAAGKPVLGICLGAQLMAQALGARVYFGGVKEIGFGAVTLSEAGKSSVLAPLADPHAAVLHWHGDTFDLPPGAVRLASNGNYPNQAFALGAGALALQFHLEADLAKLERWLVGHAAELAKAGTDIPALRREAVQRAPLYAAQGLAVFGRWLQEIG